MTHASAPTLSPTSLRCRPARQLPSYRLHKSSGQAVVTLNGKDIYLGRFGTPESRADYDRTLAEWLARGRRPPADAPDNIVTIAAVLDAFDTHADIYYRNPDGSPSDERKHYRRAVRPLRDLFAALPAMQFGPLALEEVRNRMVEAGWCRKVINRQVGRLRSVFDWAVSRELISPAVLEALRTLDPLRAGKTKAPEREPVRPVPTEHITPVLARVSRQVRTLIELQLLTGARPGELLIMRPMDLKMPTGNSTWTSTPSQHKTAHRGHARSIVLGPKAQALLRPFLTNRATDAFLFSPKEAELERRAKQRAERKTPVQPSQAARAARSGRRRRHRAPADHYDVASYRRANRPAPPPFAESVKYAEQNLYARAAELVGDRNPREHEFSVQLRAYDASKNGRGLGVASLMAMCGALIGKSLRGGLVVVGGLNLGGSLDPLHNAVDVVELAVEKGASIILIPVSARKQLNDLSDEMATKVSVLFYSDPREAFVKAISD